MLQKTIELIDRAVTYIGLAAIFVTMLLTSADALGRYLFNHPVEGAYQVTEDYLLILAVFLVLGYSYREGAHVRVTLLVDRVGPLTRLVFAYVAQLFSIACGVALTIATWMQASDTLRRGARASGLLDYPLWPGYAAVFVGCLLMTLLMIIDLPRVRYGSSRLLAAESDGDVEKEVV